MEVFIKPNSPVPLQLREVKRFAELANLHGIQLVWDGDAQAYKVEGTPVLPPLDSVPVGRASFYHGELNPVMAESAGGTMAGPNHG